jgi:hypothetical protein
MLSGTLFALTSLAFLAGIAAAQACLDAACDLSSIFSATIRLPGGRSISGCLWDSRR